MSAKVFLLYYYYIVFNVQKVFKEHLNIIEKTKHDSP